MTEHFSINLSSPADLALCFAIRRKVFIEEQNVPEDREMDGLDETSQHYLMRLQNIAIGTARVRYIGKKAKIERVAILPQYQNRGLGKKLMQFIINDIRNNKTIEKAILGAQTSKISFYENLGFNICSDEYIDANIPHKDMQLIL